jgi:hypothetical protein
MTRKVRISLVLVALLAGAGLTAHAGLKDPDPGTVNITQYSDGTGFAIAEMGAVRASADTGAFMGCWASGYNLNTRYVSCKARNAAGTTVSCWQGGIVNNVVQGQPMMDVLGTQTSESQVEFVWDATGKCTYVYVLTDASLRPKTL